MAKTQQQRDAECYDRRKARGEEELRMRARVGTRQCLAELMDWHGIETQGEAMTLMLHHLHGLGPQASKKFFEPPRHVFVVTEKVALAFHLESLKIIRADPGDSVVIPGPASDQSASERSAFRALLPHQS